MALTFDIQLKADEEGGYSNSGQQDLNQSALTLTYDVEVTDPALGDTFDPRTVTIFDVLNAPGMPVVNLTTWENPNSGLVIPFLVCREKRGRRVDLRRSRWEVTTRWSSGQQNSEQNQQAPPANLTDYAPKVEISLGETERVLYQDLGTTPKTCSLPTGNWFAEPFIERLPTQILRITQYEASITFDQMQNRKFKTNDATYRGKAAGTWLITEVEGTEVKVPLQGGPVTAAQVVHTLEYNPAPKGWKDERALIDTHFLLSANDKGTRFPFPDGEGQTFIAGFVQLDGTDKPDQSNLPDYDDWQVYQEADYSSFLQA